MPAQPLASVDLPHLLRTDEVAELLRVSRKAVYCMVDRNEIPGVTRIGRRIRFHRDTLLSWLEAQRPPTNHP